MYNTKEVGDIGVNYDGVTNVIEKVTALYSDLKQKIDNLNDKKDHVPDYWESPEASNFVEQMNVVSGYFADFCTHYEQFIELLQKVLDLYQQEEESILTALKKYEGRTDA